MKNKLILIATAALTTYIGLAVFGVASLKAETPATPDDTSDNTNTLPPCCAVDPNEPSLDAISTPSKPDPFEQPMDIPIPAAKARASVWMESTDRQPFDLDFKMTNQNAQTLVLSELAGKPLAMSFIFTRCPNPNLCPLITLTMAHLQRDLESAGLAQNVTLALLTYDPIYDTPKRLHQYGLDRGLQFTNAMMLQPDAETFRQLLGEFQIGVDYQSNGSIDHFIELLIIDHQGRFVRDYQGNVWDNASVLADLKQLVNEQQATHGGG